MRRLTLLVAAGAMLATTTAATGCSEAGQQAAGTPPAAAPAPASPTTPLEPNASETTPPPANELSAVSLDTQARLTAEGALVLLRRCHERTGDYARCETGGATELGSHPSVPWGDDLGQVSIRGGRTTFELDSRSHSGAHFVIARTSAGTTIRTCRESKSECASGRWQAIPETAVSLRGAS